MAKTLSIIGMGAFGEFALKHLVPHFQIKIFDLKRDLGEITRTYPVQSCDVIEAAQCDIVVIAVPVRAIEGVLKQIGPHCQAGQLVMDVASVKCLPARLLRENLLEGVDIVGLHPLFGPQSGKDGIEGLNIAVTAIRGDRAEKVGAFLSGELGLNTIFCTPEEHDEQMAYVQGLTHMIAKIFQMMDIPEIKQETNTFKYLRQMVDMVKNDSDELFRAIQTDNPFVDKAKQDFFTCVAQLERNLKDVR